MSATVHVWTIDLDEDFGLISILLPFLSGEERVRSSRFHSSEHRLRYIVAHGALRTILSRYTSVAPERLALAATDTGKPFLPGFPLAFNLSHSDDVAICAVAPDGQLGADVERVRALDDADALAAQYFAADERKQYEALSGRERVMAFYSIWTRKEAFVKATGAGLNRELQSFEVDISPSITEPRLTSALEPPDLWTLRAFLPRPGYIGAVALDRPIDGLELIDWSPSAAGTPRG